MSKTFILFTKPARSKYNHVFTLFSFLLLPFVCLPTCMKTTMNKLLLYAFLVFTAISACGQKGTYRVGVIGFYNLENLFDTINDPKINDEEFLPGGTKNYT